LGNEEENADRNWKELPRSAITEHVLYVTSKIQNLELRGRTVALSAHSCSFSICWGPWNLLSKKNERERQREKRLTIDDRAAS
jgi:hypothetical protein